MQALAIFVAVVLVLQVVTAVLFVVCGGAWGIAKLRNINSSKAKRAPVHDPLATQGWASLIPIVDDNDPFHRPYPSSG